MTEDELKRRNYVIAGSIGGFLLPLAGLIGAWIFYSQGDVPAARTIGIASVLGIVVYAVALLAL